MGRLGPGILAGLVADTAGHWGLGILVGRIGLGQEGHNPGLVVVLGIH